MKLKIKDKKSPDLHIDFKDKGRFIITHEGIDVPDEIGSELLKISPLIVKNTEAIIEIPEEPKGDKNNG